VTKYLLTLCSDKSQNLRAIVIEIEDASFPIYHLGFREGEAISAIWGRQWHKPKFKSKILANEEEDLQTPDGGGR